MQLLEWIMEHANKRDQAVTPFDLAYALEVAGHVIDDEHMRITVRYRDHDYHLIVWPGAGCHDVELRYKLSGAPVAHLRYKDDAQFEASREHPFYAEQTPEFTSAWHDLLRNARVVSPS